MTRPDDVQFVAAELDRLAACADIPYTRRRELLRLSDQLARRDRPTPGGASEPFADSYYRRPGLRMRSTPTTLGAGGESPKQPLFLPRPEATP